jgi:hypothetical protein
MQIILRERDPLTRRWSTLFDVVAPGKLGALMLNESSDIEFTLIPPSLDVAVRIRIGDVVVASTRELDRADFVLWPTESGEQSCFRCRDRLLQDWVGFTDLQVEVLTGDQWESVLEVAPVQIAASKIAQQEFEALCEEIAQHSAAALLDVYGKTFFGLELEFRPGERAPVAALQRVRYAIEQMGAALKEIAAQPAYRLRTRRVREPAIAEQGVSDLTLEEACLDPSLVIRHGVGILFREHVREEATPHFNLTENRILSGFLTFLGLQLSDLESRLNAEITMREERRLYRHRANAEGDKSWWETEDEPRILEMRKLLEHLEVMRGELARLSRYPFLPRGAELREIPQSTPLLRSHRAYASAYKTVLSHFKAFRVRLGEDHLLMRGKSLPVLYEWWCVLEVIRILQGCLNICADQPSGRGSPFRRLEAERIRFVVEFTPDQAIDFEDDTGRLIRLRYVPSYRRDELSGGLAYGLLSPEEQRTPDIAVEVFGSGDRSNPVPELIIVFDAKYSSVGHQKKLEEVRMKYGKIGVFETGQVLSRQVWALVPTAPSRPVLRGPEWSGRCSVDNSGFWSERYDMASSTVGVVQAKPRMMVERSPLEGLIRLVLRRAGVAVRL